MRKLLPALLVMLVLGVANVFALAQPGQTEYVPMTDIPVSEQLPAARLLIAAYAFVWVAILGYVVMLWRRLGRVEREISALSAQLGKRR